MLTKLIKLLSPRSINKMLGCENSELQAEWESEYHDK